MKSVKRRVAVVVLAVAAITGAGATVSAVDASTTPPPKTVNTGPTNGCIVSRSLRVAVCIPRF